MWKNKIRAKGGYEMKVMLSYIIIFLAFSKLHDKFLSDQNRRLPTYLSNFYERSDENLSNIVQTQTTGEYWPQVSNLVGVAACIARIGWTAPVRMSSDLHRKSTKQARIRIRANTRLEYEAPPTGTAVGGVRAVLGGYLSIWWHCERTEWQTICNNISLGNKQHQQQ